MKKMKKYIVPQKRNQLLAVLLVVLLAAVACSISPQTIEPSRPIEISPTEPITLTPSLFPTATAISPTLQPTSTPTLSPPKTLYQENFEDSVTCFKLHSLEEYIDLGIKNDAYFVQIEGNNNFSTQCIGGYDNFVLEYDVQIIDSDIHSVFGLRYRNYLGSSYNIYLTGDNGLCWDYYDSDADKFRILAGCWGALPDEFDINDNLRITLIAAQEKMAFFINGELITAVSDRTNDYGTFGFFIANSGPGKTKVIIDNIYIRELLPEDTDVFRFEQNGY